jgi:DHA1 family bicyclomycin/chloramphenicol resistance-like MFS transporter
MALDKRQRFITILILGLLSALGPFSIDMYLPGFPVIARSLHTSIEYVGYSLSSFFIGISVGQLIYGPLLDRFGRKRPLYVGMVIYILASIGCAFASSIEVLIVLRLFQALGGCVGMVAPRAMVRDSFPVDENAKIFSLLVLILGVSPVLAPTAGSFVISAFGWNAVFIVLAVVALLTLLIVIFWLPESKQPDPGFSLRPKAIAGSFWFVMKEPQFYTNALGGWHIGGRPVCVPGGISFHIHGIIPHLGASVWFYFRAHCNRVDHQQPDEYAVAPSLFK